MNDIVERLRNEDFDFDLAQREIMASEIETERQRFHELAIDWQNQNREIERLRGELAHFNDAAEHADYKEEK